MAAVRAFSKGKNGHSGGRWVWGVLAVVVWGVCRGKSVAWGGFQPLVVRLRARLVAFAAA